MEHPIQSNRALELFVEIASTIIPPRMVRPTIQVALGLVCRDLSDESFQLYNRQNTSIKLIERVGFGFDASVYSIYMDQIPEEIPGECQSKLVVKIPHFAKSMLPNGKPLPHSVRSIELDWKIYVFVKKHLGDETLKNFVIPIFAKFDSDKGPLLLKPYIQLESLPHALEFADPDRRMTILKNLKALYSFAQTAAKRIEESRGGREDLFDGMRSIDLYPHNIGVTEDGRTVLWELGRYPTDKFCKARTSFQDYCFRYLPMRIFAENNDALQYILDS